MKHLIYVIQHIFKDKEVILRSFLRQAKLKALKYNFTNLSKSTKKQLITVFNSEGLHSVSYRGTTFGAPRADHTMISNSLQNSLSAGFVGSSRVSKHSSTYSGYDGYNGSNVTSSTISYSGGSIITTRSSSKTINSYGAGNVNTQAWGGSFITIHRNNSTQNSDGSGAQSLRRVIQFPGEDYETPPTGELDDSFASPVGDVLLPLLLMAAAYAVVRWFKNHKFVKSIKS